MWHCFIAGRAIEKAGLFENIFYCFLWWWVDLVGNGRIWGGKGRREKVEEFIWDNIGQHFVKTLKVVGGLWRSYRRSQRTDVFCNHFVRIYQGGIFDFLKILAKIIQLFIFKSYHSFWILMKWAYWKQRVIKT